MPSDNVIPLFSHRVAVARRRRTSRTARGLAAVLALTLAPVSSVADGASRLPPGHPPVGQRLPPGHPPVPGADGPAACSPDLPQGHPAVRDPRVPEGHPPVEITPCAPGSTSSGVFHPDTMPSFGEARVIET